MTLDWAGFLDSLRYMGYGVAGVFIIIAVLILLMMLLNRIFPGKKQDGR